MLRSERLKPIVHVTARHKHTFQCFNAMSHVNWRMHDGRKTNAYILRRYNQNSVHEASYDEYVKHTSKTFVSSQVLVIYSSHDVTPYFPEQFKNKIQFLIISSVLTFFLDILNNYPCYVIRISYNNKWD